MGKCQYIEIGQIKMHTHRAKVGELASHAHLNEPFQQEPGEYRKTSDDKQNRIGLQQTQQQQQQQQQRQETRGGSEAYDLSMLTNITSKLCEDMSAMSVLSMVREELVFVKREKLDLQKQIQTMQDKINQLNKDKMDIEFELKYTQQTKRETIRNMVNEMNDMREQLKKFGQK